jgi:hypothetical protein
VNRNELTLAIAGALVAAFLLGWILRWFFARLNATGPRNMARAARMAAQLHAAEEAQHRAEARLAEVEADMRQRLSDLHAELVTTQDALRRAEEQAEDVRAAYRQVLLARDRGNNG